VKAVVELAGYALRGQHPDARGGQLDRQRKTVQASAYRRHRRGVFLGHTEVRTGQGRAIEK
jgi:hypothetical protein